MLQGTHLHPSTADKHSSEGCITIILEETTKNNGKTMKKNLLLAPKHALEHALHNTT
jgi:hypothetical protein